MFYIHRFLVVVALCFGIQACETDEDCSLNGLCFSLCSGPNSPLECHCDPGWIGKSCEKLDLKPARRGTGYNHTSPNANTAADPQYKQWGNSSWGGNIVRDREDKELYHLVYDQFSHGCGLSGWRPMSFIARGESRTGPEGPYVFKERITGSFRHNAYVYWSEAEQKYLLWSIGADIPDPVKCGGINKKDFPNNISVSSAPSIRGPWSPFTVLLEGTNPAPLPLSSPSSQSSKTVLMDEDQTIFTAPSYLGPYTILSKAPWNTTDFSPTWAEDPFLYQDFRGYFHVLAHWMIDLSLDPPKKYPRVGAHMFSRKLEGPWMFRPEYGPAFTSEVVFEDGGVEVFGRRERPKVYFAGGEGRMGGAVLVTGVQKQGTGGESFTLVQGIGKA
ncbi:hypothetical protein E6O75_ATG10890 [Venturia nashicola]|uniref:EGF-like domain-containing protein n=1 Tax=Venturia nashicola TaxID=86259 RepID=A0A4Z1PAN8_9PEZI|nr:hypothetical protein E6O75_ATG10890 [Venturia nashicola]